MPKEPLTYTQRYQILAGITAFTDYTARQNAINEGTVINLDAFKPNGDASIMTTIRGGAFAIASAVAESQALAPPAPDIPPTVPDAPISLCVIPSDSALNIYFFQPSDGGSQITNYSYSTDGTTFTPLSPVQTITPLTISGLTNGTVYTLYLKAINAVGASLPSATITAAPIPSSFSPASIAGLNLWLDAHNTSNVILSGSNVSAWNDSSYETHNFTAGPSGIITYDKPSSINDRPALTFATANPTATYLSNTFNISPGSNELSVFMIVRQTDTTSGNSELFFTQNNFRHFDIFNNSNNGLLSLNIGNTTQVSSTIDIITSPPIVVIISVLASTTASMYVNGTLTGINGAARGVLSLDEELTWAISGRSFLGSIGEVIAYPTAVTDTERQKVEAYLAWKWGLQSNLPATNPWQLTPPSGESPPGAPTLDVILSGNTVVYIYYTAGTGTAVNYQYTTDAGSSYTSFSPPDIVSPNAITDVANGSPITVQFRSYNGGGSSTISNSLTATPSQPAVPAAWLVFDPNNATSYSGSGTLNNIGTFGPLSGTVTGAVTYVTGTGITGKVLNFNGGYVAFPTFNFGPAFTISAWVNPSAKFSINGILTNGFANANTAGFKFAWNGWQTTNYSMLFENGDGTAGNWYIPSSLINTVIPGVWQMLTVIFDRVGRTALFLRNGLPVGVYGITTASNMTVTGAFNIGAYMGGSYTMKAQLGLLKVYNSALTASQVYDDFLADTTTFGLPGLPTAPTLSATPGDSSVVLTFIEASTGGSPITNYSYSTDGTTFTPFNPPQTASPLTITGLSNGASYTIYIKAITAIGTSASATSVSTSLAAGAPTAPSISATPDNLSASIAFTQGSDGGSAITNYSYSTDGTTFTPFSPAQTTSPLRVTGLTNGTPYTISVKAINAIGSSVASTSVTVTPAVTVPTAPSLSATAGNTSASIAFTQGSNGGSAITNYSYSTNGTTFTPFSPAQTTSPLTITGLANGTPYTISIKAINAIGSSVASATVAVTPVASVPTAPSSLSATSGNLSASIAFTQGSNGGSAITNYSYSIDGTTFTPFSPAKTTSPVTVTGLTNGTPYTISIKAINAIGSSVASATVAVTPAPVTDRIITNLTTSLSAYNAANIDDWVAITVTEYNNLNTNVTTTTKVGIDDSYLSTATGSGLTNTNTALVANSATAKSLAIPANNYLYAFAVKWSTSEPGINMAVFTNTNSSSASGFNQVGSLLPTISSVGISYFVRKSPSATNGSSGLLGFFSGTKMDYSNPSFTGSGGYIGLKVLQGTGLTPIPDMRYLVGNGTPPAANSTLSGNLGGYGVFCIQGLTTGTLQWN